MLYFGERAQRLSNPEYDCSQPPPADSSATFCDSEGKQTPALVPCYSSFILLCSDLIPQHPSASYFSFQHNLSKNNVWFW